MEAVDVKFWSLNYGVYTHKKSTEINISHIEHYNAILEKRQNTYMQVKFIN